MLNFLQYFRNCLISFTLIGRDSSIQTYNSFHGVFDPLSENWAHIQTSLTVTYDGNYNQNKTINKESLTILKNTLKFLQCSTHFLIADENQDTNIHDAMLRLVFSGENPQYFVITLPVYQEPSQLSQLFSVLRRVDLNSKLFMLFLDQAKIGVICVICESQKFHAISMSSSTTRTSLDSLWTRVNSNQGQASLQISGQLLTRNFSMYSETGGCSANIRGLTTPPGPCAVKALLEKYNMSASRVFADRASFLTFGLLSKESVAGVGSNRYYRYQWINHAARYLPFKWIVVNDPEIFQSFFPLSKPFDSYTWVGLGLVYCIALTSLVTLIDKPGPISKLSLNLFSACTDQSCGDFAVKPDRIKVCIVMTWIFSMIIMSNAYKGNLFSFLTNRPAPVVPTSLEALVQENIQIVTLTIIFAPNGNFSVLKHDILADLMRGVAGVHYPAYYVKLNRSVLFTDVKNNSLMLRRIVDKEKVAFDIKTESFAPQFVLLSPVEGMNNWAFYLRTFTNLVVLDGKEISAFSSREVWLVERNYWANYFSTGIGRLVAGGIYGKWETNFDKSLTLKDVTNILVERGGEVALRDRLPGLFASVVLGGRGRAGVETGRKIPLSMYSFRWGTYGYGILIGLCVVAFCLELCLSS